LGLTDEDVGLLRGVDYDILTQGLIELIGYPYQRDASPFSEAYLERTSKLSMLGLEQFGMGDRPGSFSRVRMSEDKVRTKDSCWSVGTIYDPRELPGVSTAVPGIGWGVTVPTCTFDKLCTCARSPAPDDACWENGSRGGGGVACGGRPYVRRCGRPPGSSAGVVLRAVCTGVRRR
jgi:hypothetical protein